MYDLYNFLSVFTFLFLFFLFKNPQRFHLVLSFSSAKSWSEKCPSSESLLSKLTTRFLSTTGAAGATTGAGGSGAAAAALAAPAASGGATIGIARDFLCGNGCCCFCCTGAAGAIGAEATGAAATPC